MRLDTAFTTVKIYQNYGHTMYQSVFIEGNVLYTPPQMLDFEIASLNAHIAIFSMSPDVSVLSSRIFYNTLCRNFSMHFKYVYRNEIYQLHIHMVLTFVLRLGGKSIFIHATIHKISCIWIQPIKLRKREFDRLEKIWKFYQPLSCLSKQKRLF